MRGKIQGDVARGLDLHQTQQRKFEEDELTRSFTSEATMLGESQIHLLEVGPSPGGFGKLEFDPPSPEDLT